MSLTIGETPIDCARREIREELGELVLQLEQIGGTYIDRQKEGTWQMHPILFKYLDGEIKLNPEHSEYEWVGRNKIDSYDIIPGVLTDLRHLNL